MELNALNVEEPPPKKQFAGNRDIRTWVGGFLTPEEVDRAVCDFFYGDIVSFNTASSTRFNEMVAATKKAPSDYHTPTCSPWRLKHTA